MKMPRKPVLWVCGIVAAALVVALAGCVGPLVVGILQETPLKYEDVSQEEDFAPYIGRRYVLATNMLVYGVCLPPGYRKTIEQYCMKPGTLNVGGPEYLSKDRLEVGSSMEIRGVQRSVNHLRWTSPTVEAIVDLPDFPKAADVPVTVNWNYILCPEYWTEGETASLKENPEQL